MSLRRDRREREQNALGVVFPSRRHRPRDRRRRRFRELSGFIGIRSGTREGSENVRLHRRARGRGELFASGIPRKRRLRNRFEKLRLPGVLVRFGYVLPFGFGADSCVSGVPGGMKFDLLDVSRSERRVFHIVYRDPCGMS